MDTVFHGPNRRRQKSLLLKCPPSSSHPDNIPPYTPQCPEREVLTFFTNVVNHVKHLISPQWSETVGTAWNNVEQVHPYLGRHFGLAKYPQIWPGGPKMTRKCPQMTSRAPRNEVGTGSPISRPTFWDQFELGGYPQICPRRTQNDPLMAQNAYKSPH